MNTQGGYTPYHPRWHRRRVSVWWWLENRSYTVFVLRELTSVFVAGFALVTLWQVRALAQGPEAYAAFLARLRSPLFLVVNGLGFVAMLFHAITWFNLAPRAMVVRLGGRRLPDWSVAGINYLAWITLSAAVAWLLVGT